MIPVTSFAQPSFAAQSPQSPQPLSSPQSLAASSTPSAAQPFAELNLSEEQLDKKLEKLQQKGYFTVKVKPATMAFLKSHDKPDAEWSDTSAGKVISFTGTDFERASTATAMRIVNRLSQQETMLVPQEFQIRRPHDTGADQWHQDRKPKKLTCLATLEGTGTEFVLPEVAKEKFRYENGATTGPSSIHGDASLEGDIQRAKKDRFYFFAALGLTQEHVPKLVHRAPNETDRSIFLARWKMPPQR